MSFQVCSLLSSLYESIRDPNACPCDGSGYDGVPSFLEDLSDMISVEIRRKAVAKQAANESRQISKAAKAKLRIEGANDNDSGIDTSDSCDEKKSKPKKNATTK